MEKAGKMEWEVEMVGEAERTEEVERERGGEDWGVGRDAVQ